MIQNELLIDDGGRDDEFELEHSDLP
jgi:hypothetical protein